MRPEAGWLAGLEGKGKDGKFSGVRHTKSTSAA